MMSISQGFFFPPLGILGNMGKQIARILALGTSFMVNSQQRWAAFFVFLSLASFPSLEAIPAEPAPDPATQDFSEPVVARMPMRFTLEDKVIDEIEKGDLLTVIEERKDAYLVATFIGKRGLVAKENTARLAESVEVYDELIKEKPEEGRLYTLRAAAWWAAGDEKRALADYDKASDAGVRTPNAYTSRGLFHAALGNYDKAIADYTTAIKKGEKDAAPYINRAAVYLTQQKYDLAVKDYSGALDIHPKSASIYQQRAVAWKLSGQPGKAVDDYSKAIELEPKFVDAWMGRGFIRFQQGEHQQAVDDFSAAIELQPTLAPAYNNRGFNRQKLGDCSGAMADYDEAIRLAPKYALAHQNKAWLLAAGDDAALRNGKLAIESAETACKLTDYKDSGAIKALAAAFAENGEFEKAIGWQEKVVAAVAEDEQPAEREILEDYKANRPFRLADPPGDDESK